MARRNQSMAPPAVNRPPTTNRNGSSTTITPCE
jgi:hypothetical protein